ncbi:MAG: type II toxin-antitoxin system RelE/ParE family toxin [Stellaceae bacterium]
MRIRTVRHRGLKRFIEDDDDRGIRRDLVNRVRRVLTAVQSAENVEELAGPPGWRIHQLTTAPEHGAFRFRATGVSHLKSTKVKFIILTWRIITDERGN